MHNSKSASEAAFLELEKSIVGARKIFGGFVAAGGLDNTQGVATPPTANGHFDLHEYRSATLKAIFGVISEIPKVSK